MIMKWRNVIQILINYEFEYFNCIIIINYIVYYRDKDNPYRSKEYNSTELQSCI